jgi:hypothetical protein
MNNEKIDISMTLLEKTVQEAMPSLHWLDARTIAVAVLDLYHGTPCEQIRHHDEMRDLRARMLDAFIDLMVAIERPEQSAISVQHALNHLRQALRLEEDA